LEAHVTCVRDLKLEDAIANTKPFAGSIEDLPLGGAIPNGIANLFIKPVNHGLKIKLHQIIALSSFTVSKTGIRIFDSHLHR